MAFTLVTVKGRYEAPDGVDYASGTVSLSLANPMRDASNDTIVLPKSITGTLNSTGFFSVQVFASDSPGTEPQNTPYTVTENITGTAPRTYSILVPVSFAGGAGLDLADVAPVEGGGAVASPGIGANNVWTGTNTFNNTTTFRPPAATGTAEIVKGLASQTGDLTQWQNDTGSVLASVRYDGLMKAPFYRNVSDNGPYFAMNPTNIALWTFSAANLGLVLRGAASQTGDLTQWQNSAAGVLARFDAAGFLGLNIVPIYRFHVSESAVGVSGTAGLTHRVTQTPAPATAPVASANFYGSYVDLNASSANTNTNVNTFGIQGMSNIQSGAGGAGIATGIYGHAVQQSANTVNALYGTRGLAQSTGTGTVGDARGVYGHAQANGAGAVNNMYGLYGLAQTGGSQTTNITTMNGTAGVIQHQSTATITNSIAFRALSPGNTGGGTITNTYGLFIDSQVLSGATAQFAIRTFGGTTQLDTGAAGLVGLIVRGAASQTANLQQWQDSASATLFGITAAGLPRWAAAGNEQTTVGLTGTASALPNFPVKYLKVVDSAGTTLVVPAYNA